MGNGADKANKKSEHKKLISKLDEIIYWLKMLIILVGLTAVYLAVVVSGWEGLL